MSETSNSDKVWAVAALLDWTSAEFAKKGIDTARLDAEILLAHALGCRRVDLYMNYDRVPDDDSLARFRDSVRRRLAREPVAHIVGTRGFHEIEIMVEPGQFVPRPETELMVDEALARLRTIDLSRAKLLDLCTGTGAVALAILKLAPGLIAWAVDLNPQSEQSVMKNAERNGLSGRIEFLNGDLFGPVSGLGPFNVITCNPPYVPAGEIPGLMPEVRDHEPRLALDGGEDGLDTIRRLLEEAPEHLVKGGWLLVEIGEGQRGKVEALAGESLAHELTRKDLRNIPRIAVFRKK